jgi:hypothetical protein
MILSRIAHFARKSSRGIVKIDLSSVTTGRAGEQLRPANPQRVSDHDDRDEHFLSLFQVPELSQPI